MSVFHLLRENTKKPINYKNNYKLKPNENKLDVRLKFEKHLEYTTTICMTIRSGSRSKLFGLFTNTVFTFAMIKVRLTKSAGWKKHGR